MMKLKTPKQVSKFAKEYEQLYIALVQAKAVIKELRKQLKNKK